MRRRLWGYGMVMLLAPLAFLLFNPGIATAQEGGGGAVGVESLAALGQLLVPVVIGIITPYAMSGVKAIAGFVDGLSAPLQRITVVLIAYVLTVITGVVGGVLPDSLAAINPGHVDALIASGFAFGFHAIDKAREAA